MSGYPILSTLCATFFTTFALCQTVPSVADQARDILNDGLKDKNPDTRKQAVIALSLVGTAEPYPTLLASMLNDKDVPVRLAAVASLVDLRNRNTDANLRKALNDEVPEVSFAAARALWALKDSAGKSALLSVLSGDTKTSSGFIAKQKREAMRMMHTPKTMFMFAIVQGVGFAPVPGLGAGIASMQGLLSDSGTSGRATAALLLGRERDAETEDALRDALSDKDWSVRAAAVHSLALQNDSRRESDFVPLLMDKNAGVRLRAAAACVRLETIKHRPRRSRTMLGAKPPAAKNGERK